MKFRILNIQNDYCTMLKQQQSGAPQPPFEEYYKTVPQYKNDTTHYE